MSSFYQREGEPQNGDCADHNIYYYDPYDKCTHSRNERVTLVGKIDVHDNYGETFWLVEKEDNSLIIVRESDLLSIGYYGD